MLEASLCLIWNTIRVLLFMFSHDCCSQWSAERGWLMSYGAWCIQELRQHQCHCVSCWWYDQWQHSADRLQCLLASAWHVLARVQSTVVRQGCLWNYLCRVHVVVDALRWVRYHRSDTTAITWFHSQHHQCHCVSLLHCTGCRVTSQDHADWPCNACFLPAVDL